MIASGVYNIELPTDETFLSLPENMTIVQAIFQQAFRKFIEIYKNKEVPLSFIEFYFKEIKNYSYMFRKQTKQFFDSYDTTSPNLVTIAEIYNKSYFAQTEKLFYKDGVPYMLLKKLEVIDYFNEMLDNSEKDTMSAVQNIKKITEHINGSDEIIPFDKTYENYMISEMVKKTEFKKYAGKSKLIINVFDNSSKPQIISATRRAEKLVSERINISKQHGKVTKLVIPKLKLPSAYPKTTTFNRFNSKYNAKNFISASRQILILNDLKINGVAYTTNFVEKRKAANDSN